MVVIYLSYNYLFGLYPVLILYVILIIHLEDIDCKACLSEFIEKKVCECMANRRCKVAEIVSPGCKSCRDTAMEYCNSLTGSIIIWYGG